jgi:DNA-binding response OmpR family regulator
VINMKILIIEDSPIIVETITLALEMRWPDTKIIDTTRGEKGLEMIEAESPDIIILDIGLPDISGFDVLKRIRLFSNIPILILTARSDEADIVKGLEWGADDYMVKPFKQLELQARINGIIRRRSFLKDESLIVGNLRFDPGSMRLFSGRTEINISRTEGLILGTLMRNPGNVVNYGVIAEAIWGDDFAEASNSVRVHIRHLREKLEADAGKPQLILTKTGIGYYLAKPS